MKYAVIAISGTQYQVREGQIITVNKIDSKTTSTDQVLLYVDDKSIKIGNPTVKGVSIKYEIVKNYQGDKIKIFKYKAKSRYRRHYGFRPQLTDVKIVKISDSKKETSKPEKAKTIKPKILKTKALAH